MDVFYAALKVRGDIRLVLLVGTQNRFLLRLNLFYPIERTTPLPMKLIIWVTDFTLGMLRLAVSLCAMCTFIKVPHPYPIYEWRPFQDSQSKKWKMKHG